MRKSLGVVFVVAVFGVLLGVVSTRTQRAGALPVTGSLVRPNPPSAESVAERLREAVADGPDSLDPGVESLVVAHPQPQGSARLAGVIKEAVAR